MLSKDIILLIQTFIPDLFYLFLPEFIKCIKITGTLVDIIEKAPTILDKILLSYPNLNTILIDSKFLDFPIKDLLIKNNIKELYAPFLKNGLNQLTGAYKKIGINGCNTYLKSMELIKTDEMHVYDYDGDFYYYNKSNIKRLFLYIEYIEPFHKKTLHPIINCTIEEIQFSYIYPSNIQKCDIMDDEVKFSPFIEYFDVEKISINTNNIDLSFINSIDVKKIYLQNKYENRPYMKIWVNSPDILKKDYINAFDEVYLHTKIHLNEYGKYKKIK